MNKKPETAKEWCLERAILTCKAGRDVLNDKTPTPPGSTPIEFALFLLIGAVGEIADYLQMKEEKE